MQRTEACEVEDTSQWTQSTAQPCPERQFFDAPLLTSLCRLLDRGIVVSSALQCLLTEKEKVILIDESVEDMVAEIARHIEEISDETVSKALLVLAGQICTLRIINRKPA